MKTKKTTVFILLIAGCFLNISLLRAQQQRSFTLVFNTKSGYGTEFSTRGGGPVVGGYQLPPYYCKNNTTYNFRDYYYYPTNPAEGTMNDRFWSVDISAEAGETITFFNNADADYSGGTCIVKIKQSVSNYKLISFEDSYEDKYVKVNYWYEGTELNGDISSFNVVP